jgi:hypothetical protein
VRIQPTRTPWHSSQITDEIERARAARARSEEKQRKKDEKIALRKAQRGEAEPTDETNSPLEEKQS